MTQVLVSGRGLVFRNKGACWRLKIRGVGIYLLLVLKPMRLNLSQSTIIRLMKSGAERSEFFDRLRGSTTIVRGHPALCWNGKFLILYQDVIISHCM